MQNNGYTLLQTGLNCFTFQILLCEQVRFEAIHSYLTLPNLSNVTQVFLASN